jgi:hypothetical protein
VHDTWLSKKLWFSVFCLVLVFSYALLSATILPKLESSYSVFTGALEFIAAAYLTGNITNKMVAARAVPVAEEALEGTLPKS